MSGSLSAVQCWVTVMNGIKFEFNDIKLLFTKNDSVRRQSIRLSTNNITVYYYYI